MLCERDCRSEKSFARCRERGPLRLHHPTSRNQARGQTLSRNQSTGDAIRILCRDSPSLPRMSGCVTPQDVLVHAQSRSQHSAECKRVSASRGRILLLLQRLEQTTDATKNDDDGHRKDHESICFSPMLQIFCGHHGFFCGHLWAALKESPNMRSGPCESTLSRLLRETP